MENLKKVKEVSIVDEFQAVMDLLSALGYETDQLTVDEVATIRYDILKIIKAQLAFTPPPNTQIRIYKGNKVSKRKFVY